MGNKTNLTESHIESFAIELLEKEGFSYIYGPDFAPDSDNPMRGSFEDVIIPDLLKKAVDRINSSIPEDARVDAIKQVMRLSSPELISSNEVFHRMLTEGITVNYQKDGTKRGDLVWLVDFKNPENNDFVAINQFTIIENNVNKRPTLSFL